MEPDPFVTPSNSDLSSLLTPSEYQVPVSSSFSFSVSGFWKPENAPILQWIQGLPSPVKHDQVFEPARYQTVKHGLDHDDVDESHDFDSHRRKRARLSSAAESRLISESRSSKLLDSGRGLVRRVSNRVSEGCRRVVGRDRQRKASNKPDLFIPRSGTPCPEPTAPAGTALYTLIDRPKMRFVFVGDARCGKSSILLRIYRDTFSEVSAPCTVSKLVGSGQLIKGPAQTYKPTKYELFNKSIAVDEQIIDIELWDTAGNVELEQLGCLSYLAWDAVFLCFSVDSEKSFNNARTQWITQIRRYTRGAPLILVGTKTDQRVGASLWAPLYPHLKTKITATEGVMIATEIGAVRYVECSAKTGQGIMGAVEEGARAVFHDRAACDQLKRKNAHRRSSMAEFLCFK